MRAGVKVKSEQVKALSAELTNVSAVAVVSLHNLPSNQLSRLKKALGLKLRVASKNVLSRALKKADKGLEGLVDHLEGPCALLLLDDDVFKVLIKLKKEREPSFVKPGMILEDDVVLEEGPTPFMPGEMMTKLSEFGVQVSPKGGKVTIMKDFTIAKVGEVVSKDLAELLFELGLKPVSTGIDLIAAFDGKTLMTSNDLVIDVDAIMSNLLSAHAGAVNLAFNANIITKFTIGNLLQKAFTQAINLAREAAIVTTDNVGELLSNASYKAGALAGVINWEVKA